MKSYTLREKIKDEERENLKAYPELLQELLFFRGIKDRDEAERFLNPDYTRHTHDPYLLKDMEKAVQRILKAIEKEEKIVIWGDYDADGIPGGVVLHDFFKKIGYENFENHIPDRNVDGFGLNIKVIDEMEKKGVKLIITVDCGTGNVKEVERANAHGIEVIITDHHLSPHELPPAYAIVNPKQKDCAYPEKMLCGSGVVFKLIQALITKLRNSSSVNVPNVGWEKWLLDMVALGTLSDMVPLTGENRVFSYYGLKVLRKSARVGLMKLLREAKTSQRDLTEDDVGFTISPRINAASRMGLSRDAFSLLSTKDDIEAERLVIHLNKINDERKGIVGAMVKEMKGRLEEKKDEEVSIIVMGNPSWRPSLLGLAANTLAEEYNCPVFLWGRDGDNKLKGSCRANGTLNVVSLMEAVSPGTLSEFGGHMFSGGFGISHEKVHLLEEELFKAYEKIKAQRESASPFFIDRKMTLDEVNFNTWRHIEKLAPFGIGNPKPVFLFENIPIFKIDEFGKEKNHLKLTFKKNPFDNVQALKFFSKKQDFAVPLEPNRKINLVGTMEKSLFRNFPEIRLRIIDIT